MSIVSDRHSFVEFISGQSKPFKDEQGNEQRLAKVGYKSKSGKKSVCVSIPRLDDGDVNRINAAFPVDLRKRAEDFQDSLIRSLYESDKSEVSTEEISVSQVLAYLEAENSAGRLSADKVKEWWNGEFQDIAVPVLSEKYQTEDEKELAKKSKAWGDVFVAITGNSAVDITRLHQLRSMCEFVESEDVIGQRVKLKVDTMIKEFESLDAL